MDPATFFIELKRRRVYRVAVAYAIVAWLLIQAASILFPTFEAPPWVIKVFVTARSGKMGNWVASKHLTFICFEFFGRVVTATRIIDHFNRERLPPPVVRITRFIMTSIVS